MQRRLLALLAIAGFIFVSMLAPTSAQTAHADSVNTYGFECRPPGFGQGGCGGSYSVGNGKYVDVRLYSNSEGGATFRIYNASNGNKLGEVHVDTGNTQRIWTNNLGSDITVYFQADADPPWEITLRGQYQVQI